MGDSEDFTKELSPEFPEEMPIETEKDIVIPAETKKEDDKILMKPNAPLKKQPVQKKNEPETIEPKTLKKAKIVQRPKEEEKKEQIKLRHHDFESVPSENLPEMKSGIKLGKPLEVKDDGLKQKPTKKVNKVSTKATKKATESEIVSPTQDRESPFEDEPINAEQAKITKISDHDKAIKLTTQLGFEPSKEMAERKERDPIAVPGAAIPKKHSDFEKVELPAYLNYPSEQGVSVLSDEVNEASEVIIERVHEDSDGKHTPVTAKGIQTKKAKKITKKTITPKKTSNIEIKEDSSEAEAFIEEKINKELPTEKLEESKPEFREIPMIIEKDKIKKTKKVTKKTVTESQVGFCCFGLSFGEKTSLANHLFQPVIEEPTDEIVEKLESLAIVEASEKDLVFDKVYKQLRQACLFLMII